MILEFHYQGSIARPMPEPALYGDPPDLKPPGAICARVAAGFMAHSAMLIGPRIVACRRFGTMRPLDIQEKPIPNCKDPIRFRVQIWDRHGWVTGTMILATTYTIHRPT